MEKLWKKLGFPQILECLFNPILIQIGEIKMKKGKTFFFKYILAAKKKELFLYQVKETKFTLQKSTFFSKKIYTTVILKTDANRLLHFRSIILIKFLAAMIIKEKDYHFLTK